MPYYDLAFILQSVESLQIETEEAPNSGYPLTGMQLQMTKELQI